MRRNHRSLEETQAMCGRHSNLKRAKNQPNCSCSADWRYWQSVGCLPSCHPKTEVEEMIEPSDQIRSCHVMAQHHEHCCISRVKVNLRDQVTDTRCSRFRLPNPHP